MRTSARTGAGAAISGRHAGKLPPRKVRKIFRQHIYCSVNQKNERRNFMANKRGIPERRIAFLETCFEVFCENGLENTGLKMLAEACGVTNGASALLFRQQGQHRHRIHRPLHGKGGGRLSWRKRPRALRTLSGFCGKCPILRQSSTAKNTALCTRSTPAPNTGNTARHSSKA